MRLSLARYNPMTIAAKFVVGCVFELIAAIFSKQHGFDAVLQKGLGHELKAVRKMW